MARGRKQAQMPVTGGVRRNRNRPPALQPTSADATVLHYSALGRNLATDTFGNEGFDRHYIAGNSTGLINATGSSVASFYSTSKFQPGTTIRWEPSVSFTTPGRVYVSFTDNPEVMVAINALYTAYVTGGKTQAQYNAYSAAVKGLGNIRSFPVWQETAMALPTNTRRKRFDVNLAAAFNNVDVMERCTQYAMYVCVDGASVSTTLGSFWFSDSLSLEGLTNVLT